MGLQHTQRAWGLAPPSRARHRRVMVSSVAPSQRARSIVPCRLTLAALQLWLQRALALHWKSRAKRVVPPSMGLQHTQRAWGWRPPPELGTVASWRLVLRRPSPRALLCRAASNWRRSSRGSSAGSRCTGSHTRSAWYLHRCQRQHGEGERSSRHHSLAKDTSEAAPAWPGRAHLVLCSQPTVAQAEAHARSLGVGARETTAHVTANTSSATAQPSPAR